jgi:16S rRNA (guanine527-N7)-methyltransferase
VTPETFAALFSASPTVMARLRLYEALLVDWQKRMNLVGPATLPDVWSRHFADSAQLAEIVPRGTILDMGAGGGFPGLVLAAMNLGPVTLVESIAKKCRFLEAARDAMKVDATIIQARVETLSTLGVVTVTARAAAPLSVLLDWGIRHLRPGGLGIFPKGRRWAEEVEDAAKGFRFALDARQSMTDPEARILVISGLRRR